VTGASSAPRQEYRDDHRPDDRRYEERRYEERRYDDRDERYGKKKKRRGFLEDLFEFD